MTEQNFEDWFKTITGNSPYQYQTRLAKDELPTVIDVATGLGKTAAIVLAWLWRRRYGRDANADAGQPNSWRN